MLTKKEQKERLAEERARETLLENGWALRAGHGSSAVMVAEKKDRAIYGARIADLLQTASGRGEFARKTREGPAQRAAGQGS
jgi:hypothetical protein